MRTVNIANHPNSKFNAFPLSQPSDQQNKQQNQLKFTLLEQLQTTLEVKNLINIFATKIAKNIDFIGLYYKFNDISVTTLGSCQTKIERQFELKINGKFLGTLSYALNTPLSASHYKMLTEFHQLLINPLNNAIKYYEAMNLAMQDALTQLGNRRSFDSQLKRTMAQAMRRHSRVGLILCDLDKFKNINDTFGHAIGDSVLIHFANALRQSVRDTDSVFRFGGDEFAIIVEDACQESLAVIENRIHQALLDDALLEKYNISSSLGLTLMNKADNVLSFFQRADSALYIRKNHNSASLSIVTKQATSQKAIS